MQLIQDYLKQIDDIIWGPAMLFLLVGTGIFLTVRLRFMPWRNLFPSLKSLFSRESIVKGGSGSGDVSPFAALMTALASTIGTGNIVGVATAMVAGGPGALVWMWISAAFGISTKFAECALSLKYRCKDSNGEMLGGPMYSIRAAFNNNPVGKVLAGCFALFTLLASFGIGNLTQANSISDSLNTSFTVPEWLSGIILAVLTLTIVLGGIQIISKVASVLVPAMAVFYIIGGLIIVFGNIQGIPNGLKNIFVMAFSPKSVAGGFAGTLTATILSSMRYGIGRGVFSNEAGMGSAAITAAASYTNSHIKQGYINMCGTFLDTIVVCSITGLAIASSGVLGTVTPSAQGKYTVSGHTLTITSQSIGSNKKAQTAVYDLAFSESGFTLTDKDGVKTAYTPSAGEKISYGSATELDAELKNLTPVYTGGRPEGTFTAENGTHLKFSPDGKYEELTLCTGVKLTIEAFRTVLGDFGAYLVTVGLMLFAFSTIIGWEYNGEKALEYLAGSTKLNIFYRIFFSGTVFVGAVAALDAVWSFSDIANGLMIIPNIISLIILSGTLAYDTKKYHSLLKK